MNMSIKLMRDVNTERKGSEQVYLAVIRLAVVIYLT